MKALKALVYEALAWFSTVLPKLHPKSVGGSVDKVFAYRYRPRLIGLSGVWLKNDQVCAKTTNLNKSRIFLA
jgi:hypothetical protein